MNHRRYVVATLLTHAIGFFFLMFLMVTIGANAQIAGETKKVTVPVVTEPWSKTTISDAQAAAMKPVREPELEGEPVAPIAETAPSSQIQQPAPKQQSANRPQAVGA